MDRNYVQRLYDEAMEEVRKFEVIIKRSTFA